MQLRDAIWPVDASFKVPDVIVSDKSKAKCSLRTQVTSKENWRGGGTQRFFFILFYVCKKCITIFLTIIIIKCVSYLLYSKVLEYIKLLPA